MSKYHIYQISGLAADQRVYDRLQINAQSIHFLPWLEPQKSETLQHYAARMAKGIKHTENVIILGLSFGGIVAQEIAAQIPISKLILLSTIQKKQHLPWLLRMAKYLPLHKIPKSTDQRIKNMHIWGRFLGINKPAATELFADMMSQHSNYYFAWSIDQIIRWQGIQHPSPSLHIHGSHDRIFPIERIPQATIIRGATHMMVYSHASKLNPIINKYIS